MDVRDAMTRGAETIDPDATLQEAARRMRAAGIGALPVCERDRLIGMLTDRDIVVRCTAEGLDPNRARVREAMTPQVIWCLDGEDLYAAARLMEDRAIRRLIVLDERRRLAGMLSVDDVAAASHVLAAEIIEQTREPRVLEGAAPAPRPGVGGHA